MPMLQSCGIKNRRTSLGVTLGGELLPVKHHADPTKTKAPKTVGRNTTKQQKEATMLKPVSVCCCMRLTCSGHGFPPSRWLRASSGESAPRTSPQTQPQSYGAYPLNQAPRWFLYHSLHKRQAVTLPQLAEFDSQLNYAR